jgi:hypothetical protein
MDTCFALCNQIKLDLKLKTRPTQILGYLPSDTVLPAADNWDSVIMKLTHAVDGNIKAYHHCKNGMYFALIIFKMAHNELRS